MGTVVLAALAAGMFIAVQAHILSPRNVQDGVIGGVIGVLAWNIWKKTKPS